MAALKFFEKKALKAGVTVLGGMLALLLVFSNPLALIALAAIAGFTLTRSRRGHRAKPASHPTAEPGADSLT